VGQPDLVVIGAGWRGFATAQNLVDAAQTFDVIKAQDCVGGPMHSVLLADGRINERGGKYFSRNMTELRGLVAHVVVRHRVIHALPGHLRVSQPERL
jgi:uncharacterized protein with NAD-binding domain and iron-sulfur cluster